MSFETKTTTKWNGRDVKVRGKKASGKTIFEIGMVVEGHARLLINNVTGRLAGSITTQAADNGTSVDAPATSVDQIAAPRTPNEVFVGTAVDYGPYVEFGTRRSDARPFLRPALELARGRAVSIGTKHGKAELKEYLR